MKPEEQAKLVRSIELALRPYATEHSPASYAEVHAAGIVKGLETFIRLTPNASEKEITKMIWELLSMPPRPIALKLRKQAAIDVYKTYETFMKEKERDKSDE